MVPLLAIAFSIQPGVCVPSETVKLIKEQPADINVQAGLEFTHTAQYRRDFAAAVKNARRVCEAYKRDHGKDMKAAIVSDIDETIVDNRGDLERNPTFDKQEFEVWIQESCAPVLKPSADFLKWARKQGFAILLLTGRPERDRRATILNLVRDGVAYDALYMRTNDDKSPAEDYKTAVRKTIEDMGFSIVVNIGDQNSDLAGGHAFDCEKLPNRMYFIK